MCEIFSSIDLAAIILGLALALVGFLNIATIVEQTLNSIKMITIERLEITRSNLAKAFNMAVKAIVAYLLVIITSSLLMMFVIGLFIAISHFISNDRTIFGYTLNIYYAALFMLFPLFAALQSFISRSALPLSYGFLALLWLSVAMMHGIFRILSLPPGRILGSLGFIVALVPLFRFYLC